MSVHQSKRTLSAHEFEHTYSEFYYMFTAQLRKVPIRKQKWICHPINTILNNVMHCIIRINETMMQKDKNIESYCTLVGKAIDMLLLDLPPHLFTYFSVSPVEQKKIDRILDYLNREISMLEGIVRKYNPTYKRARIKLYSRSKVKDAAFLSKAEELEKFTMTHVIHSPNIYDDSVSSLLMRSISQCFYLLYKGNDIIPKNKEQYNQRTQYFKDARIQLAEYDKSQFGLFSLMNYNNDLMEQWVGLLVELQKLVEAIMKSDAKRFGKLP